MKTTNSSSKHKFKKSLGQNFLSDKNLFGSIIDKVGISNNIVLEIGSGLGIFTELIAQKAHQVIGYEIDQSLYEKSMVHNQNQANVQFQLTDILDLDWNQTLLQLQSPGKNIIIMGNLPYYIATKIIFDLLPYNHLISKMCFCIQKEVGQKIICSSGGKSYGAIGVIAQHYYQVRNIKNVNRKMFFPVPKVDSCFILFDQNKNMPFNLDFHLFAKKLFAHRRKTLLNNLLGIFTNKQTASSFLQSQNLNHQTRIDEISPQEIFKIYQGYLKWTENQS